jgi:hypothetical protein
MLARLVTAACLALAIGAPTASATVREGGIADEIRSGSFGEGTSGLVDVARVDARYDDEAGTVSVAFTLVHSLREHLNFTSAFTASVAQTDVAGACRAATANADLELTGRFVSSFSAGSGSFELATANVSGVGIPFSGAVADVSSDGKLFTMTAVGAPLTHRDYRCLTNLRHDMSFADVDQPPVADEISPFFFTGVFGAPPGGGVAGEQTTSPPKAAISGQPVTLRGRTVIVPVTCPGTGADVYTGVVRLRTAGRVLVGSRRRMVSLASRRFGCEAGDRLPFHLKLSRRDTRIVARLGRVRVRASVVLRDEAGRVGRSAVTFTLRSG